MTLTSPVIVEAEQPVLPASQVFNSYVTTLKETVPPGTYLGYLVWYSVFESVELTHQDYLDRLTLTEAPMPAQNPPRAGDIFRRACTATERTWRRRNNDGTTFTNFLIRDAGYDAHTVYKSVIMEIVDAEDHVLSFDQVGDITFRKNTGLLGCDPIPETPYLDEFNIICDTISSFMKDNAEALNAYRIREAFRQGLEYQLRACKVRESGGLYFVNDLYHAELARMEHFASTIPSSGVQFHVMPCPDDAKQRAMLREAFKDESVGEAERLVSDMAAILKSGENPTAKKVEALNLRLLEIRVKAKQYAALLDDSMTDLGAKLQVCNQQLGKLIERET